MGHGAENMWGDLQTFQNGDLVHLNNSMHPVVISMNCLNGAYQTPSLESMAKALLRAKGRGAIAFWGSTSLTPPSLQDIFQRSLYEVLTKGEQPRLGDVVRAAKLKAGLGTPCAEILNSWTLLGDPLISLPLQDQEGVSQPEGNDKPEAEPEATVSGSYHSVGGCPAFAGAGERSSQSPWGPLLNLILEAVCFVGVIRIFRKVT